MFSLSFPLAVLAASILADASPLAQGSPASSTSTPFAGPATDPSLLQALELAPTSEQRQSLLTANGTSADNLIFTFSNTTFIADVTSFPALLDTHIDFSVGSISPCSLIMPHSHPRANEFLTVVGGKLVAAQLLASDAVLNYTLELFQGTVFSQGYTHYQYNPTCEPAFFAAAFDNHDPGRVKAAQSLFSILADGAVEPSMGFPELLGPTNIDEYRASVGNFASLIDSCAKQCGLASGTNSSAPTHP